jgi:hypothetical protein
VRRGGCICDEVFAAIEYEEQMAVGESRHEVVHALDAAGERRLVADAIWPAMKAPSESGARSVKQTFFHWPSGRRCAISNASRVFPIPAEPVRVTASKASECVEEFFPGPDRPLAGTRLGGFFDTDGIDLDFVARARRGILTSSLSELLFEDERNQAW